MINKVLLLGNVGNKVETRYLENGNAVATFSLATNEFYKNKKGEKNKVTEWHRIVAWRKQAEFAEKYIKKGSKIYVEGKIRYRKWTDQFGKEFQLAEIYADNLQIIANSQEDKNLSTKKTEEKSNLNDLLKPLDEVDSLPF